MKISYAMKTQWPLVCYVNFRVGDQGNIWLIIVQKDRHQVDLYREKRFTGL